MRILVTADWQTSFDNLSRCGSIADRILVLCKEQDLEAVIVAGDLKAAYNPLDVRIIHWWLNFIERAINQGIQVVLLLGNHDRLGLYQDDVNWLPILERAGAHIYWEMGSWKSSDGDTVWLLPFTGNPERWQTELNKLHAQKVSKNDVLIFHHDLAGSVNARGIQWQGGIPVGELKPERFKYCLGGHIHKPQRIDKNVYYVGSPFPMDWSEVNHSKFFAVIKDKLRWVKTGMPGWYDPSLKGFKTPESWDETRIRIRVPVLKGEDYGHKLSEAQALAAVKYKGASLHVTAEFIEQDSVEADRNIELSDGEQIAEYIRQVMPETLADQTPAMIRYIERKIQATSKGLRENTGIKFEWLKAEHFLCFNSLDVKLDTKGIVVITGKNMDWLGTSNGCLAKGTLIDCPRNLNKYKWGVPIENLVGKRPWVYGFDEKLGRIVLRRAEWIRKTGDSVPVIKITFRNTFGDPTRYKRLTYRPQKIKPKPKTKLTHLILTHDHLIMCIKTGLGNTWPLKWFWRRADKLKVGDRIMPFYRSIRDGKYYRVRLNNGTSELESRFILSELYGNKSKKWHAHHKDENTSNNIIKNLEWKTAKRHASDHGDKVRTKNGTFGSLWKNGHPRGFLGHHHSQDEKDIISTSLRKSWSLRKATYANHRVVSIKSSGTSDVYDISVPEINNFVANTVIVHNSGKSSLLSSVPVALFGTTFKGQSFDAWTQRGNEEPSKVELGFTTGDGRSIRVLRSRNPTATRVWVNDQEISSGSKSTDVGKQIQNICGFSWDTFASTVYLDQAEVGAFLSGTPKQKQELIAQLQNLERFSLALDRVKFEYRRQDALAAEVTFDIDTLHDRILDKKRNNVAVEELQRVKIELAAAEKRIQAIKVPEKPSSKEYGALQAKAGELSESLGKWRTKASSLSKEIASLEKLGGKCPQCQQSVDKKIIVSHIRVKNEELSKAEALAESTWVEYDAATNLVDKKQAEYMTRLNQWHKIGNEFQNAAASKERLLVEQERWTQKAALVEKQETALGDKLNLMQQWLAILLEDNLFLKQAVNILSRDGLPAYMSRLIYPKLNKAAKYFSELFSSGQIQVRFTLVEGEIDAEILNPYGGATLKDQSAGERRIAALIASFALREVGVKSNILILDEPADGLDATNARAFAEGVKKLKSQYTTVFLVTHNQTMQAELSDENQIVVVKEGGISSVQTAPKI